MLFTGLWLLSRKPVDPESTATMLKTAEELGLDVSGLKPVTQAGCTYASLPAGSSSSSDSASHARMAAPADSSSEGNTPGVNIAALLAQGRAAAAQGSAKPDSKAPAKSEGDAGNKAESPDKSKEADPLAVTQKVELSISVGGKPAGTINIGLFGNAVPKTVANVSMHDWDGRLNDSGLGPLARCIHIALFMSCCMSIFTRFLHGQ